MSVEANKATVLRFFDEVLNQDQETHEFADHDYINYDPKGRATQGVLPNITSFRKAAPDLHYTITQMLGEGDLVAVQWVASGTHQQPIEHLTAEFAQPAKGHRVSVTGVSIFRFEGDKIAELWNHWDAHHLLQQISGQ